VGRLKFHSLVQKLISIAVTIDEAERKLKSKLTFLNPAAYENQARIGFASEAV